MRGSWSAELSRDGTVRTERTWATQGRTQSPVVSHWDWAGVRWRGG